LILHLGSGLDSHNIVDEADGFRSISMDINEEALRKNKNYLRICGDRSKLPFKCGVFDIIMCENVFEHIIDLKAVLGEC
jgi:ubiquinone/menaquinone biosynthesis C-methylase UbiE